MSKIGENTDVFVYLGVGAIPYSNDAEPFGVEHPILFFVPQFTVPVSGVIQIIPHVFIEGGGVFAGFEVICLEANNFIAGIAGSIFKCFVYVENSCLFIGYDNCVAGFSGNSGCNI